MTKKTLGYAMASYYGGRAEARVRRIAVPIAVIDFTSQYPTVFLLQELQDIATSKTVRQRIATREVRTLLEQVTLEDLYDRAVWPQLNGIVLVRPQGDILPVRMRLREKDALTITITHFTSSFPRWYTIADLVAAKLLGGTIPRVEKAICFAGKGDNPDLQSIPFLGVTLDPNTPIMATIIEERQRAKKAGKAEPGALRRELALKLLGASAAYGIFGEVNVTAAAGPSRHSVLRVSAGQEGVWYADVSPNSGPVHDERPGRFYSPILASLVTGGGRLLLAMAETEVARRGGVFAFCDTDSLGICSGPEGPPDVPRLADRDVDEIVTAFDRLNPYDRDVIPHLLKREYAEIAKEAQIWGWIVSAKRYTLYTRDRKNRLRIVKASESGMGASMGRTPNETIHKLARRMWTSILIRELGFQYRGRRRTRMQQLLAFDVPMRRKLPIAQPSVHQARGFRQYNRTRNYDHQIKPFSFLQTVTPAVQTSADDVHPVAPFERDLSASRRAHLDRLCVG